MTRPEHWTRLHEISGEEAVRRLVNRVMDSNVNPGDCYVIYIPPDELAALVEWSRTCPDPDKT